MGDEDVEECISGPFEIGFCLFRITECTDTIPEWGSGQKCVSPMATHVGCDYAIAVPNEEERYETKDFWWKTSVDGREPIQYKVDACVYSVNHTLDFGNLGQIQFCRPGTELNRGSMGTMSVIILTQVARPVLTWCAVRVKVAGSIIRGQGKSLGVSPSFGERYVKGSEGPPVARSTMSGDSEEQVAW